jgi:hypothetical protein
MALVDDGAGNSVDVLSGVGFCSRAVAQPVRVPSVLEFAVALGQPSVEAGSMATQSDVRRITLSLPGAGRFPGGSHSVSSARESSRRSSGCGWSTMRLRSVQITGRRRDVRQADVGPGDLECPGQRVVCRELASEYYANHHDRAMLTGKDHRPTVKAGIERARHLLGEVPRFRYPLEKPALL